MQTQFTIEHQDSQCRFIATDTEAVLEYTLDSQNHAIDFNRTYVPFKLRGSGVAQLLLNAALKWAEHQDKQITASCWFVDKALKSKQL